MNMKKLFLLNLPYLLFVYPFDKLAQAFRLAPGADLSGKLLSIGDGFTAALSSPWLSFHPTDLLIGIAGAVILRMAVYLKGKNAKKYRHGIEYGSARWGTAADIAPYMDKDFFQNIPMTQTERITMASRPKQPKYARNKNILVIGGSGSGKTRFFCKPSLLQAHSSYVCTDPKGTLLPEIGTFLERKKYRIKCLNLINFRKSMRYNPLAYIRSEKDILKLVNALIMNTKGEGEKSSEDFWVKAERLYYSALIGYIWYEATEEEKNFITLLDLINASEAREDDETYQSPVDLLFSQLEEREPDHFAVKQYRKFKMAAGKTLKSILISCGARLAPFDIKELRDLMEYDELELDTLGDQKTALFVILSDTDSTFNFVAALMYSQLFNLLCDKADDFYGGRLPVHVRLILDEFANIGQIPNFDKLIATIRSREISASIILQSQSQLKTIYKDAADTIVGNCDSTLFLGGKEKSTLKEISELLGKETIDLYNQSENRGSQVSHGLSYQKLGKECLHVFVGFCRIIFLNQSFPSILHNSFAFGGKHGTATVQLNNCLCVSVRIANSYAQPIRDQLQNCKFTLGKFAQIAFLQFSGRNDGMVICDLFVIHNLLCMNWYVIHILHGECVESQLYEVGQAMCHIFRQKPAVGTGISDQFLFIEVLRVVQGLLCRVAKHTVGFSL